MSKKLCPTCGNVLGKGIQARIFINREIFEHVIVCEDCAKLGLLLLPATDARFSVRGILIPYARYLRRMADGLTLDADPRAPGLYQAADILETGRALSPDELGEGAPRKPTPSPTANGAAVPHLTRAKSLGGGTMLLEAPARVPAPSDEVRGMVSHAAQSLATLSLAECERAILTVLRDHPHASRRKIAIFAGYSVTSGSFGQAIATLRAIEFVEGRQGATMALTDKGAQANWTPITLPKGAALFEYWQRRFGECGGRILEALRREYPIPRSRTEIARLTGYSVTSGSFGSTLAKLTKAELIESHGLAGLAASSAFIAATKKEEARS
jgi:hypothetical protein